MRCHIVNLRRDGEGSFTTRGTLRDGHPVPITFTSKIMSNAETSDVRMILDEGSIKELAITPPSSLDRWMALHGLADRPPRRHRGRRQGIGNRERARLDLFFGASVDDDHFY
jgi:hypothetical protein